VNEKYFNEEGLLNSHTLGGVDENSILYYYEYYLLHDGIASTHPLFQYISKCHTRKGVFNQYPEMHGNKEDYMSHDQLTTICNFSYLIGLNWHKEIWQEILDQGFRYDNVNPDNPTSWLHPRDIIYIAYLNKHWIGYLFFPILALIMLETTFNNRKVRPEIWDRIKIRIQTGAWPEKKEFYSTDGKLLNFTRIRTCDRFLMNCVGLFINFVVHVTGGWDRIFNIYFPSDHPNSVLARIVYGKRD